MATDTRTSKRNYPLPFPSNLLAEDVVRLRDALTALDIDVDELFTVMATKLNQSQVQTLVQQAVDGLMAGAPGALNTLGELAAALNNDQAFSVTVTNALTQANNAAQAAQSAASAAQTTANNALSTATTAQTTAQSAVASVASSQATALAAVEATRGSLGFAFPNSNFNTTGAGHAPLPHPRYGRGEQAPVNWVGHRRGAYISRSGRHFSWGNNFNNATNGNYYNAAGLGTDYNTSSIPALPTVFRVPSWHWQALAGDPTNAKFATTLDGQPVTDTVARQPRIIRTWSGVYNSFFLSDNGILFGCGYAANGLVGNGTTPTQFDAAVPLQFYDESSTLLTGSARPKIRQFASTATGDAATLAGSFYSLDTDGNVYAFGTNAYGQLGDGTTTANFFARRIPRSWFGNENVEYITCNGGRYAAVYAITASGKCFAWGYNAMGNLGINNLVNQNRPVDVTAVANSPLNGRKIVHVISCDGDVANTKTWFLTSEGRLFAAGSGESFGIYLGVYTSTSANQQMPVEITNASTTTNSGGQQIASVWVCGGRYPTVYCITNGGTSNQPKVYSFGNNANGQLGRNVALTSDTTASVIGAWFAGEIMFRDYGDPQQAAGSPSVFPGEIMATQYSTAWNNEFRFGRPVAVLSNGYASTTGSSVALLDDRGQLYICGVWTQTPVIYPTFANPNNSASANTNHVVFTPVWNQPEPIADFTHISPYLGETCWAAIGQSGTVYVGGETMWGQTTVAVVLRGQFHPLPISGF
jgi:alpha-tubulin suppressor-like RCC1 family protein